MLPRRRPRALAPAAALAAALALIACADDGSGSASASAGETTGIATVTVSGPSTTGASASASESDGSASGGESEGTSGGPKEVLCPAIDVSLVMDPLAPIYNYPSRDALAALFDRLVTETGARVRVQPNAGTEFMLDPPGCPGGPILTWGEGFEVDPAAFEALDCRMEAALAYTSDIDEGDWIFSGLMFPILELADWPADDATGLALLLSASDDQLGGMYSRPGMTSEAYLRLVGQGDRRRVATMTYGKEADELPLFALSLGPRSRHYDLRYNALPKALDKFADQAIGACDDRDYVPDLPQPEGCKRIDVLFVIDGSLSMKDEQAALSGLGGEPPVFAEFTDALLAELTDVEDFHVGVVTSEPGVSLLHTHSGFPVEPESPETDCGLPEGQRWIVGPSPLLEEQFACIGATRSGVDEHTALNGALALLDPANEGFLRDDSLLFVVMITDEDTQDYVKAWMVEIHDLYMEAVGGDASRLLMLAIIGDQGVFEMPKTLCTGPYGTAAPGRRITSIVRSFGERGLTQDICAGSMAATFAGVLDDVVSACEAVTPIP